MKVGDPVRCRETGQEGEVIQRRPAWVMANQPPALMHVLWDTPVGLEADSAWLSELDLEVIE